MSEDDNKWMSLYFSLPELRLWCRLSFYFSFPELITVFFSYCWLCFYGTFIFSLFMIIIVFLFHNSWRLEIHVSYISSLSLQWSVFYYMMNLPLLISSFTNLCFLSFSFIFYWAYHRYILYFLLFSFVWFLYMITILIFFNL